MEVSAIINRWRGERMLVCKYRNIVSITILVFLIPSIANGENPKLFSTNKRLRGADILVGSDYYLLSSKSSNKSDGIYVEGLIRAIVTDNENKLTSHEAERFQARCSSKNGKPLGVSYDNFATMWQLEESPSFASRDHYNLWWAVCKNEYRKF
jgi:hypothetical protein